MSAASDYAGGGEIPSELVRVVKGTPDEAELAALVAGIVAARTTAAEPDGPQARTSSAWQDRGRRLGLAPRPGGDSWRWSSAPR